MRVIANPIYDSVFKYLLEDTDLAREFLATILGEEIVSIEVKPQETTIELASHSINIFRLDFKAVIKTATGEHRKVLIELQKAKHLLDIMRFRRYLADNYHKEDAVPSAHGSVENVPLPIVTIYLLGFKLTQGYPAVFKLNHQVTDVLTGAVLAVRPREPFVELLNHESYTIQIPLLPEAARTLLEEVLSLFSQKHRTDDPHKLSYFGETKNPLVKKMVDRLTRAIADEDLRRHMDVEDEVDHTITRLLRDKDAVIEEKETLLQVQKTALEESRNELARKEQQIADLLKRLEGGQPNPSIDE